MSVSELTPPMEQTPEYDKSPDAMAVAALTVAAEDLLARNEKMVTAMPEGEYSPLKYADSIAEDGDHVRRSERYTGAGTECVTATTTAEEPGVVSYEYERTYSGGVQTVNKWTGNGTEVSTMSRDSNGVVREDVLSVERIEKEARDLEEKAKATQEAIQKVPQKSRAFGRGILGIFRRK